MKICSVTLCGNAENDIADAIASVVDYVDIVCFINTGCTDQSSNIAKQIAGDKFVEKFYTWKNDFSDARNSFFQYASELECDYFLIVDSDERIVFDEGFKKQDLIRILENEKLEGYQFQYQSQTGNFSYLKEKILSTKVFSDRLRWTQKTHECFPMLDIKSRVLTQCRFRELPKTKEKLIKKCERDILILRKDLSINPDEPRSYFYMARSYHDLYGQTGKVGYATSAISWYDKRKELLGYSDERYISQLYSSRIKLNLPQYYTRDQVINSFLDCTKYNSNRLEHWEWLIEHYHNQKDWETAYIYSQYAVHKKYNNFLFNEPGIYSWKIYDLHCLSLFYLQNKTEIRPWANKLKDALRQGVVPIEHRDRITKNLEFYFK